MNLRFKFILVFVLILLTTNDQLRTAFAQSHKKSGTNTAQILEIRSGTRPAAMGGAFVALSDDANAIDYNPAGLGFLHKNELQFNQNKYFDEVISNNINWVYALTEFHAKDVEDMGVLAGGFTFVDYGRIMGRDINGVDTGEFGAKDRVISLSYGKAFNQYFSIGITGKEFHEDIYAIKTRGYSFDAGLLFNKLMDGLSIGFAAKNMGSGIALEKETQPLPRVYVLGGAINLFRNRLTLVADLNKPLHDFYYWALGGECWVTKILALRLGYNTKNDLGNRLTTGVGVNLHEFDFSFLP
ncbi:MAG: PorV/PorQ family protein, partial [bacterium]|nr:PorV/PorQ family protein [bacterium]